MVRSSPPCDCAQAAEGKAPVIDPAAAKKAAEEAEERRLAEIRALGTPVTPDTFNAWKAQFYAESALARTRSAARVRVRLGSGLAPELWLWLGLRPGPGLGFRVRVDKGGQSPRPGLFLLTHKLQSLACRASPIKQLTLRVRCHREPQQPNRPRTALALRLL